MVFSEAVHCALIVLCEVAVFSLLLQCFFLGFVCIEWLLCGLEAAMECLCMYSPTWEEH